MQNQETIKPESSRISGIKKIVSLSVVSVIISILAVILSVRTYSTSQRPYLGVTSTNLRGKLVFGGAISVELKLENKGALPARVKSKKVTVIMNLDGENEHVEELDRSYDDRRSVTLLPDDSIMREITVNFVKTSGVVISCPPIPKDAPDDIYVGKILFVDGVGCIKVDNIREIINSGKGKLEVIARYSYEWEGLWRSVEKNYLIHMKLEEIDENGEPFFIILSSGDE